MRDTDALREALAEAVRAVQAERSATPDPHKERSSQRGGSAGVRHESRPAAGAVLTSPLTTDTGGKVTGPVAHAGTGDTDAREARRRAPCPPGEPGCPVGGGKPNGCHWCRS